MFICLIVSYHLTVYWLTLAEPGSRPRRDGMHQCHSAKLSQDSYCTQKEYFEAQPFFIHLILSCILPHVKEEVPGWSSTPFLYERLTLDKSKRATRNASMLFVFAINNNTPKM
jgi:hypothetical protein